LLGAFLVPVTFVAYLYERLPSWDVPLQTLAVCFLWGGVLGTIFAGRYRSEAAGIVLGVATAAGFASLETMGYGFASWLSSKDNLAVLDEVLLVRGLTSPAGHMAWTGLVCAVLWRGRLKVGHATLDWRVLGAFLTAVVLHALWDTFASVRSPTPVGAPAGRIETLELVEARS
jgi:protease PrsW